jgi:gamma-aminobutyric acid receptor subunit rho
MAFDGCYHDNDIDLASFGEAASTTNTERTAHSRDSVADSAPGEGTRLRRKNPVVRKLQYVMSNSHMIDSYSRVIFPMSYLLFNVIYWSMYT